MTKHTTPIKDETLRLLFSVGHMNWLRGEMRHHVISLGLSGFVLLVTVVGFFGRIEALYFLIIFSPIWAIIAIKALYEIHKVHGWKRDHVSFLAKYNRMA